MIYGINPGYGAWATTDARTETDDELRARVLYVSGDTEAAIATGAHLDLVAARYLLVRRWV